MRIRDLGRRYWIDIVVLEMVVVSLLASSGLLAGVLITWLVGPSGMARFVIIMVAMSGSAVVGGWLAQPVIDRVVVDRRDTR